MPKKWTGNLVGLMHDKKITNNQLAEHLGLSYQYVSMVLNEKRNPPGAKERFESAVLELISKASNPTALQETAKMQARKDVDNGFAKVPSRNLDVK